MRSEALLLWIGCFVVVLQQHSLHFTIAFLHGTVTTRNHRRCCRFQQQRLDKYKDSVTFLPVVVDRAQKPVSWIPLSLSSGVQVESQTQTGAPSDDDEVDNVFQLVAGRAAVCLMESDIKRDAIGGNSGSGEGGGMVVASGATNWINDASAFALRQAFDRLRILWPEERVGMGREDRDEASAWIRWMKTVPSPVIIDFSPWFRQLAGEVISEQSLKLIDQKKQEFVDRIGCRMILLPSGLSLTRPLAESPGSLVYGKLLYGGVIRSRLLTSSSSSGSIKSPPRQAAVRQEVKTSAEDNIPAWIMFGGPDRMYESVDIGPAAVLEVVLLPCGKSLKGALDGQMVIDGFGWNPQRMFDFVVDEKDVGQNPNNDEEQKKDAISIRRGYYSPSSLSGQERNEAFRSGFQSSVGGLQPQIDAIVRRVLDGRIIRPADDADAQQQQQHGVGQGGLVGHDRTSSNLAATSLEAEELALIGLAPVRGLLLYGPPGCGKTALAREISKALRARAPKIVSAPELLDRWVGGSEKLVRGLFADAEAELAANNGDASRSALHVIVIDEIDAVFRKRTSSDESGESTRSSVVNQILSKLDGVNAIPNVLLIGMTNRRELLDDALLRPGRLEVQIEIPLPDQEGRREILQIHFRILREKGRLSKPLCCAIDGTTTTTSSSSLGQVEKTPASGVKIATLPAGGAGGGGKRNQLKSSLRKLVRSFQGSKRNYDLAADCYTGGFSGADIAGLVRCAGSIALARTRLDGSGLEGMLITLEDVMLALEEVKQK